MKARQNINRRRFSTETTWTNDHHYEYTGGDAARVYEYPTSFVPYNRPPTPSAEPPPRRPRPPKFHFNFGIGNSRQKMRGKLNPFRPPKPQKQQQEQQQSQQQQHQEVHISEPKSPVNIIHHHKYNIIYYGVDSEGKSAKLPPNFAPPGPVYVSHQSSPSSHEQVQEHSSNQAEGLYDGVTFEFRIPSQNSNNNNNEEVVYNVNEGPYNPPATSYGIPDSPGAVVETSDSSYYDVPPTHEGVITTYEIPADSLPPTGSYGIPAGQQQYGAPGSYNFPGTAPALSNNYVVSSTSTQGSSAGHAGVPGNLRGSSNNYGIPSQGSPPSGSFSYGAPHPSQNNGNTISYRPPPSQNGNTISYGPPSSHETVHVFTSPSEGNVQSGYRGNSQESSLVLPNDIQFFTAEDAIKSSSESDEVILNYSHEHGLTPCDRIRRRKDKKKSPQPPKTLGNLMRGVLARFSPQMKANNRNSKGPKNQQQKMRQAARRAGVQKTQNRSKVHRKRKNNNNSKKKNEQISRMNPIGYKVAVPQGVQ